MKRRDSRTGEERAAIAPRDRAMEEHTGRSNSVAYKGEGGQTKPRATKAVVPSRTLQFKSFFPVTVRSTMNANHLHNELLRKKLECEHLGRKNKFISNELRMEKYVTRKLAADKAEFLETKHKALVSEQERLIQREKDAIDRAQRVAAELEGTKQQLDDIRGIANEAQKESERIVEEMEKIRLENKTLVEEIRCATMGEIEATRRADAAERQAAEEAQRRWRLETQTKLTLLDKEQTEQQLAEARQQQRALQQVLDEAEKNKSQREDKGTQTAVRVCLQCAGHRPYRGVYVQQCELMNLHGLRREQARGHSMTLPHLNQRSHGLPNLSEPQTPEHQNDKKSPSPATSENLPSPREDNQRDGRLNISISLPSPRKLPKRPSGLRYAMVPVDVPTEEDGDIVEVFEY
ncbi:Hypp2803 [Branchiostoma lanceolatum]|uniref:Hypp2803 protein n=1 Tax=Branchiostoma lanceolatum TaxID=7740 RepID=A0A8J9ZW40_BRALA|nr:Hypp2803 [Branchiostoma lanceolatum]